MLLSNQRTGLWSPACIQHGFSDSSSFTDGNYRVPSGTGKSVTETVK
jgi:hypothetical protein